MNNDRNETRLRHLLQEQTELIVLKLRISPCRLKHEGDRSHETFPKSVRILKIAVQVADYS